MIVWLAQVATPQFVPILNRLRNDYDLAIETHYLHPGSQGRGWGDLDIQHPHEYHVPRGFVRDLLDGWVLSRSASLRGAVVFGYSSGFAMGLLAGCRLRGIPVFTQSDSDYAQHRDRPLAVRVAKNMALRVLYARKTRVWVVGESNARYWHAHHLDNQRHVSFESPIAVSDEEMTKDVPREGPAIVLYIGRFSPEKRVGDAVAAVRDLRASGLDVVLRVVGQGDLSEIGEVSVAEQAWLHRCGSVPHRDLGKHYLEADVLVVPSQREPFGLVVREALQFGLPVVATDIVPAAKELCDLGWNLVPVRDTAALAEALRHAIALRVRWPSQPPVDTATFYYEELREIGQEA